MGVQGDDIENGVVRKLIAHAAVAGGLRIMARREPDAAKGLLRAAGFHSQRVQALAGEIAKVGGAGGKSSAAFLMSPKGPGRFPET